MEIARAEPVFPGVGLFISAAASTPPLSLPHVALLQFAFKPDTTKSQKAMEGVNTPLEELVQNRRQKLVLDAAKQAVDEAERSECTFHPKINKMKVPAPTMMCLTRSGRRSLYRGIHVRRERVGFFPRSRVLLSVPRDTRTP
jgi:hypothetical protein